MKGIKKVLLVGFVVASTLMVGCKKNKDEGTTQQLDPTLTFAADSGVVTSDVTVSPNTQVHFKIIAQKGADGAKLKTFTFRVTNPGGAQYINAPRDISGINQGNSYTFDTTITMPQQEGTYKCEFIVTDKDNRTATRTINVTVQAQQVVAPKHYTNVVLTYSSGYTQNAFYSTSSGTAYNGSNAPSNASSIDIAYFYSSTSGHNLVSPADLNNSNIYGSYAITWGQVNTEFRSVDEATYPFDQINNAATLDTIFNAGLPVEVTCGSSTCSGTRINQNTVSNSDPLAVGNTYAFKGTNGKYGIIKIVAVDDANQSITLEIKVQP